MFTTRSEEYFESQGRNPRDINMNAKNYGKHSRPSGKPSHEEFKKYSYEDPHGPYCEETYYAMSDESDILQGNERTKKKIEIKSESHVKIMSDTKSEYYCSTDETPFKTKQESPKFKKKKESKIDDIKVKNENIVNLTVSKQPKYTGLLNQPPSEQSKMQLDEKKLEKAITVKHPNAEFPESDTDAELMTTAKHSYPYTDSSSRLPNVARPKSSENMSKLESAYQNRSTETIPCKSDHKNSIGVESTKITKIADSSDHHKRFMTMQQTTRVIKFTEPGISKEELYPKIQSMPELEPFPFVTEPTKSRKDRGYPPPKPRIFRKGEFKDSDYDSDHEGRIKPKWQPLESDAEEPSYSKVNVLKIESQKTSKERERTPTPPSKFEIPPPTGDIMRPIIEPIDVQKISSNLEDTDVEISNYQSDRDCLSIHRSPELPPPGSPPQEGVIYETVDYVVDKVNLENKPVSTEVKTVQTYKHVPYREVVETIEKKITDKNYKEEIKLRKDRVESVTTVVNKPRAKPKYSTERDAIKIKTPIKDEKYVKPRVEHDPIATNLESISQPGISIVPITAIIEKDNANIKKPTKILTKKNIEKKVQTDRGLEIDIDITDVYDYAYISETDSEIGKIKPYPDLEPFPFEAESGRPKRPRGPPPPMPKKFLKGEYKESDYESDYEQPIPPKWLPGDSESEDISYRKVKPVLPEARLKLNTQISKEPLPPSKFDEPPHFDGPPRPVVDIDDIPRRERRESLEEYSIPKFPKVQFQPFNLEDNADNKQAKILSKTTQDYVGNQWDDMTQSFRSKAQKFAEQLVSEVFAGRETGPGVTEPAGEPPLLQQELKEATKPDYYVAQEKNAPQAYRDESRVSEFGSKHIDPETGLIYFKYDFGYEFGLILPGEGVAKMPKIKTSTEEKSGSVPFPVIHVKSEDSIHKGQRKSQQYFSETSEVPSQSDLSETEYVQYIGKKIPQFIPKKKAQFCPIRADVASESGDSDAQKVSKLVYDGAQLANGSHKAGHPQKPVIITPIREMRGSSGTDLCLECVVGSGGGGDSLPLGVQWLKNDDPVAEGPKYQSSLMNGVCGLLIKHLQPGDDGRYTCVIENPFGKETSSAVVEVAGDKAGEVKGN